MNETMCQNQTKNGIVALEVKWCDALVPVFYEFNEKDMLRRLSQIQIFISEVSSF